MTLVEILVASTLCLIVVTVALSFLIQTLKTYQYETGKLLINRDIRKFTEQMIDDATYANSFMLFDQASNLSRSLYTAVGSTDPTSSNYKGYVTPLNLPGPDNPVTATGPGTLNVIGGMPGDVVVFIYNVNNTSQTIPPIQQLIIYYRWIATTPGLTDGTNSTIVANRVASLNRLVVTIPTAYQSAGILNLLPDLNSTTPSTVIFPYVDGQASDIPASPSVNRNNKMFYNYGPGSGNNSLLVRGRIYENYTAQRLVKSTYNFTVTTRG